MENGGNTELEKISAALRETGLGDLIEAKENNRYPILLITDILGFIPEIEAEIEKVRKRFGIDPKKVFEELESCIGRDDLKRFLRPVDDIRKGKLTPLSKLNGERSSAIESKIENWEKKNFPKLSGEVGKLRFYSSNILPLSWHRAIKDHILYGRSFRISPVVFRKQTPEIKVSVDSKTAEPYLELRIYADTNLDFLKNIKNLKGLQKKLPNYYDPDRLSESTLLRRFLYFVIRKHLGFKHEDANNWLEGKGFGVDDGSGVIDFEHGSREITRFLKTFQKTQPI